MSGLRSARTRLALATTAVFVGLTVALVLVFLIAGGGGGVVHVSVAHSSSAAQAVPRPSSPNGVNVTPLIHVTPGTVAALQKNADSHRIVAIGLIALVVAALVSIPAGWVLSGRTLRPVRQITERARMISAGNLHERLALTGPNDEFKQLGDTLDDLLARLEASFDAQRRFVASASHELRTPLTVERALLQVALADPNASAATLRATCEELLATGREQERLLEALLTLASSERGLDRREPVDLAPETAHALSIPRPEIERLGLRITSDLQPATVEGDPALLERLLANLLDNATQHNVAGGSVEVRTGVDAESGSPYLEIANSGVVIPESEIAPLFEPFRRLGQQRVGGEDGHHGLGLSIVRAIATAHAATVVAVPRDGGGLTIRVNFAGA
jgi:signal transduction histidine kinase